TCSFSVCTRSSCAVSFNSISTRRSSSVTIHFSLGRDDERRTDRKLAARPVCRSPWLGKRRLVKPCRQSVGRAISGAAATGAHACRGVDQLLVQQAAQYVLHDAAMPVIGGFTGGVDTQQGVELFGACPDLHCRWNTAIIQCGHADDVEGLFPGQPQYLRVLPLLVLQWQDAHAQQVGAVDALV